MFWVVVAVLFATVCLATSFVIIRRHDPTRLTDHAARSLVQIGIATVTVLVAFLLFRAQLGEQDDRLKAQQAHSAMATLRFMVVAAGEAPKHNDMLFPLMSTLDCRIKDECDQHDRDLFALQKAALDNLYYNPSKFFLGRQNVKDDILQLVKGNYVFADKLLDSSLYAAEQYESGYREIANDFDRLRDEYHAAEVDNFGTTPNSKLGILYEKFARLQGKSAQIAVTFICRLEQLNQHLLNNTQPGAPMPSRYPPIDTGITCPPYDAPFENILRWYEVRR
jgi:hypothetical protein